MGKFDATIKELERADRIIQELSEENKRLKIELQYYQNLNEENKKRNASNQDRAKKDL